LGVARRLGRLRHLPKLRLDLGIERFDLFVQEVDMGQMRAQKETMMIAHKPAQSFGERFALLAHAPTRQLGHGGGVGLAFDEGSEHRPCRDTRDIGGDTGELDVGSLQHFLQTVDDIGALRHEVGALAGQIAQVSLRTRRDETRFDEPMPQQLRQPGGILGIGLVAGHILVVTGVDHPQLEGAFQNVVDGLPILARALHSHMRTAKGGQPVAQSEQGGGRGRKRACLLLGLAIGEGKDATGDDESLVHVQGSTAFKQHLHGSLPPWGCRQALCLGKV
jgi:hypothetical protein